VGLPAGHGARPAPFEPLLRLHRVGLVPVPDAFPTAGTDRCCDCSIDGVSPALLLGRTGIALRRLHVEHGRSSKYGRSTEGAESTVRPSWRRSIGNYSRGRRADSDLRGYVAEGPRATKSRRARGVSAPCVTFYRLPAGNRPRAVLDHGAELSEAEVLMVAFCRRVPRSDTAQEVLIVLCRWRMLIINSYTSSISSIPGCVCPCRLSPAPQNGCSRTPQPSAIPPWSSWRSS
jgi:hypothetical protein